MSQQLERPGKEVVSSFLHCSTCRYDVVGGCVMLAEIKACPFRGGKPLPGQGAKHELVEPRAVCYPTENFNYCLDDGGTQCWCRFCPSFQRQACSRAASYDRQRRVKGPIGANV